MSTPDQPTVNAAAQAAQDAIRTAANSAFIADSDIVIQEMVAQGKFAVSLPAIKPASMKDIATYYRNLGYGVTYEWCSDWGCEFQYPFQYPFYPDYPFYAYYAFWQVCTCKQHCKITISWKS